MLIAVAMKLLAVVVLFLACFPVLLDCFSSGRPALHPAIDYPTGTPTPSAALNMGSARVAVVNPAHPNNRGFLASTVSIRTAARGTSHHGVTSIANTAFHLNLGHDLSPFIDIHEWLRANSVRFIGGAIAICEYLLFLIVGLVFLQRQIVLPLQSEPVIVPIPVEPTGPVVKCRVPETRAPVPPAKPARRPLVRKPSLKPTIARLGGPRNNPAPQPVAPVQPLRRDSWIERLSVEGKLVLYSHHTGRGGSVEWTVLYFPRHEHSYYLSQYPASPRVNPLLEILTSSRSLVVKVPGSIMEEVCDYILCKTGIGLEVDAISTPLPLSRLERLGAPTSLDLMESSSAPTLTLRPDSGSQAGVASSTSPTTNANTNLVEPISLSLSPAIRRRHSCPSLQTDFAHAPSQEGHSSRRASIAFEQMASFYLSRPETEDEPTSIDMIESSNTLTPTQSDSDSKTVVGSTADDDANSVVAGSFPPPHLKPAVRRRHSFPNPSHAPSEQRHSFRRASIASEQMERLYVFRPESPDGATSIDMMESPNALTLTQRDSESETVFGSTADADANSVGASSFPLPHLKTRRRHSCSDLRIHFSPAPSQQVRSSRRLSIAFDQRARLRLIRPHHAPQHSVDSGIGWEPNIAAMSNSAEEDGGNIKQEVKFKFRRGGKRNTARKHRRQMQDQNQGNSGAGPSSAN